jgi:hypothetical protein
MNFFKKSFEKYFEDISKKEIIKIGTKNRYSNLKPIEYFDDVLSYMCYDVHRNILLTSYMKKSLTELFGKHNTRLKTSEYYYYVWIFDFDGDIFHIFTDPKKGASISIVGELDDKKTKVIINFLRKLEELFNLNNA